MFARRNALSKTNRPFFLIQCHYIKIETFSLPLLTHSMYSKGFREAALLCYEKCKNMKIVAKMLNISTATIWSWLRHGIKTQPRTQSSPASYIVKFILETLKTNPSFTKLDLHRKVFDQFNIKLSKRCLATILSCQKISRKRLRFRGASNRSQNTKYDRLTKFQQRINSTRDKNVFSVDECGFDFRCLPTYGYAPRGEKAIMTRVTSGRTRVSLLMAINAQGDSKFMFVEKTTNASKFKELLHLLPPKSLLIMDNCSIHKTQEVRDQMLSNEQEALYIPPYTPECNPIENVFGKIKFEFRKHLASEMKTDNGKAYKDILRTIIMNLPEGLFANCFRHMAKWVEKTLQTLSSETCLSND